MLEGETLNHQLLALVQGQTLAWRTHIMVIKAPAFRSADGCPSNARPTIPTQGEEPDAELERAASQSPDIGASLARANHVDDTLNDLRKPRVEAQGNYDQVLPGESAAATQQQSAKHTNIIKSNRWKGETSSFACKSGLIISHLTFLYLRLDIGRRWDPLQASPRTPVTRMASKPALHNMSTM